MLKQKKINNKDGFIFASVLLFLVLSCALLINAALNNTQADGVFLPAIRLIGEYKVGDGEWKPVVQGEHISATKGDVKLKGFLECYDPETNETIWPVSAGTLISLNLNHINFSVSDNGEVIYVTDTENPLIGEDACGHVWQIFEYIGEDGYIEATIHNSHKFGNETAVDELLSSMNVSLGDYFEKMALGSGQSERLVAIIILIAAIFVLGITAFSRLFYAGIFKTAFFSGMIILFAGIFFLFTSRAFYLWSDRVIVNTMVTGKQKPALLLAAAGLMLLLADIAAAYFGAWRTGLASKICFLIVFLISAVVFLRIVPKNLKAKKRAEQLEKEKITLDAELARSRISTLMSQIHPHFIYNTLGSIEQLCKLDPPKAAKLVHEFSKYLRGNFGEINNTRLIRVSKELEHTEYYISIEKVRFPDIEFVTEMSCCDFSVPALTIQPIVENAVKHGILKRDAGGTVMVRIYETDSSYFITVKDNGVGFDVTELENDNHIGLRNIRSRLEAMCGGILHIESILGVGTKITVEIPKEAD